MSELIRQLWSRDLSIWNDDAVTQASVANRLGWLRAPKEFHGKIEEIDVFVNQVRRDYDDVVVLGMGGSSLCVEVLRDVFATKEQRPHVHILDSTHPGAIARIERRIDLARTLFIVASKSGTTLESDSLYRYFWKQCESFVNPGGNFCAITDPDTALYRLAIERDFVQVFTNPPDIGGRFSALSYFGLVPAAILGVDLRDYLDRAEQMALESNSDSAANSPYLLGRWLAENAQKGRNKMVLVTEPRLGSFGLWAEQLIAESTGKSGQGILPIVSDAPVLRREPDTITVNLSITGRTGASTHDTELDLELGSELDLGAEFFRWEFATAICGAWLGINPFDEPNVTESKSRTNAVLSMVEAGQAPPDLAKQLSPDDVHAFLNQHITPGGYIALLAFVDPSPLVHDRLLGLRESLERRYHRPVTVGLGPRFLHSTGQLHKGGPENGVFVQFVDEPASDPAVPGKGFGFRTLIRAQAQGDLMALADRSRPTLCVNLGSEPARELELLASEEVVS